MSQVFQTEGRYPLLSLGTAVDTAGSAAESKSLAKMLLIQHFFGLFQTTTFHSGQHREQDVEMLILSPHSIWFRDREVW